MKIEIMDWNKEFEKDIENKKGLLITNPEGIDKNRERSPDGIYSMNYGTEQSKDTYIMYSCECGNLVGKFFSGKICPECGTKVDYKEDDIEKTGWLELKEYHLIHPTMFQILSKAIGKKAFLTIIKFISKIDLDGQEIIELEDNKPESIYYNIGITGFQNKFDEIITFFEELKPQNKQYFDFIKENKDKIFINKIPIFSLLLRPILIKDDNIIYSDINTEFAILVKDIVGINNKVSRIDKKKIKILPTLYQAQEKLNNIFGYIIDYMLGGKGGHIRNNMLGMRVNFSSRCVIIPLSSEFDIDEIHLPYLCVLELYKFELINLITKLLSCSFIEAEKLWFKATIKFDKKIYLLMKTLINKSKSPIRLLVNRNPSINYGSIICMRLTQVKEDINDLTMSLPISTLGLLSADFDGDGAVRSL